MDTKSITEGALMAALTAVLALAGIYVPVLEPLIMLVWTLPVVVICLRRGMRAGVLTMATAGLVILVVATPTYALDMMLRSTGPALLIGYGFRRRWKSEVTILYAAVAAFIGMAVSYAISFVVMGISISELFSVDQETMDQFIALLTDNGVLEWAKISAQELSEYVLTMFSMMKYLFPGILVVASLSAAFTNFVAANFILGKLKMPLPPTTRLADFRLPFGCVFAFILGMGLSVTGNAFWPDTPAIALVGQNIMLCFFALYFFQGMGLISYYLGKADPSTRKILRAVLIIVCIILLFYFFTIVCFVGVADALFDFRSGKMHGGGV